MEDIIIHSSNKEQAQKSKRLATEKGCKINSTEFPDDYNKGIKQKFSCPRGTSEKLINEVKEPGFIERNGPDKVKTSFTEHNFKKKRRF